MFIGRGSLILFGEMEVRDLQRHSPRRKRSIDQTLPWMEELCGAKEEDDISCKVPQRKSVP